MRKVQPYSHIPTDTGLVVGSTPTRKTARHFGDGAFIGLRTSGNLAAAVPIQDPWAGQGARYPAFPFALPSDVAPNAIRVVLMSAQNFFSPSSHSKHPSLLAPGIAEPPGGIRGSSAVMPKGGGKGGGHTWRMPWKQNRRVSGSSVIPDPPNFPNWPSIMSRMVR